MQLKTGHPRKRRRGSVLVMSIFILLVLFITASAFLTLLPVENRAALRTEQIVQGGLVADAGIADALAWARFQLAPPTGVSQEPMQSGVYPSATARTRNLGNGWAYRWELVADSQTFPNGSNPIRAYTIISKAFRNGQSFRVARAEVIQESMTKYAELYDEWPDNLVKGVRSTSAPVGGPVHSNDEIRFWISEGAAFWSSPGAAPYTNGVTSHNTVSGSQDGFGYYQGNYGGSDSNKVPYNAGGPIESRYLRMATGGKGAVKSGVDKVPLPTNTFQVKDAAWGYGTSNPIPTSPGVYFNQVAGKVQGVYVEGNVEEMELGVGGAQPSLASTPVDYGSNSWTKIELPIVGQRSIDTHQATTVVTVESSPVIIPVGATLNGTVVTAAAGPQTFAAGTTIVRRPNGTYESFSSALNGVIYVNGDVRDVWGVNKGRRTLAVSGDTGSGVSHDIIIGGKESDSYTDAEQAAANKPLSYAAAQKGIVQWGATDANSDGILDAPTTGDNVLGLVGSNVMISSRIRNSGRWDTSQTQTNPLYLYATVLGGLDGSSGTYAVQDYGSGGGGWAYKYGSRIMVNAGAWGTTGGDGLVNGTTFFDAGAAQNPPPYFPSKPTFSLKSYIELPLDGETL